MNKLFSCIALALLVCASQTATAQKKMVKKVTVAQQTAQSSPGNVWISVSQTQAPNVPMRLKLKRYTLYKLNVSALRAQFKTFSSNYATASIVNIPMPNGTTRTFRVWETSMMDDKMAQLYPDIKTYTGEAVDDKRVTAKFDFTLFGFHSVVFDGEQMAFIDPYDQYNDGYYLLHYKTDEDRPYSQRMSCKVHTDNDLQTDKMQLLPNALPATNLKQLNVLPPPSGLSVAGMAQLTGSSPTMEAAPTNGSSIRTYRIALSANTQYCVAATGLPSPSIAQCLSAVTTSMNRVNGVYNRELSVQLNFVANESLLIWPSATGSSNGADPFNSINSDAVACINQNQSTCDTRIGNANYDVGHVFTTGAGGLAALGVICNTTNKARGVTGSSFPVGDAYDIDYVCHELGHQFGSNHTFNNNVDNACAGNASSANAYEPASGATIMDYAGICSPDNIQSNSDPYFSARSLDRIQLHMSGSGGTCAATTASGHSPLSVSAFAATYNIPYKTPFELTSPTATPGGSDTAITYCWHQTNLGDFGNKLSQTFVNGPIFRSYQPVYQPTRIFPRLSNVLSGTLTNTGEKAPDTTRYLTFRTVIRNVSTGMGCFNIPDDTVHLNVYSTGSTGGYAGFRVTSQNSAVSYTGGSTQTITWNVVGTNVAPVNATNVDIYMSTDGGNTWPHFIGTFPNSGTASVSIPNPGTTTTTARIKVKGNGNVFFNVNSSNFTVTPGSATAAITGTFTVCATSTTDLDNATTGGTWSSSTPAVGTVNSTNGIVTGISAGTTTITYHAGSGNVTAVVSVIATPTVAATTGASSVCAGSTISLGNTTPGGVWSSTNTAAGTVSASGVVTGIAAGSTTISYTVANACGTVAATKSIVVNPTVTVAAITGTATVCAGSITSLSNTTPSGSWSSVNTAVGTVSGAGVVTGIANGTTTISYIVTGACGTVAATKVVTVSATPTVNVTGGGTIPEGTSATLTASGASTYTWAPPNVLSATTGTSVAAAAYGTVIYTVTGTSGSCGTGTATVSVTGTPAPSPNIYRFAGGGGSEADGEMATAAALTNPADIFIDASGTKYITLNPGGGHRIRKISPAGIVTTVAGAGGPYAFTPDGGQATAAVLHVVRSAVADAAGNVYFAEEGNNRVRRVDAATGILTTVAGNGSAAGAASDGIQATAASLTPVGVRLNGGYLYIACSASHRVRKVNLATGEITSVAGNGSPGGTAEGVAATSTSLSTPWGLAFDGAGNMYISQAGSSVISVVRPDGKIYRVAGIPLNYTYNGDGIATTKTFGTPYHIALDGSGNLLVPDMPNNRLRKIYVATGMMTTIAGTGPNDGIGDGGPATAANLAWPIAAATDASGNIYVCDWLGARIRVIGSTCTTPTISISGGGTICAGASATLTASGAGSYSWAPSAGLSAASGASVSATPTTTTTYTVTGGTGSCSNTATVTVSVNPLPTITGATGLCIGASASLTAAPTGGSWTASNGNATVSSAGEVTGAAPGTVDIRYTLPTGCYKDHVVNVGTSPTVSVAGGASVCSGTSSVLTASGASSYSWVPAAGLSATTGSSVTATPSVTTIYTVVGTSGGSCAGTATVTINVSSSFPLSAGTGVAICSGSATVLSATGGATSYSWSPASSLSAATGAAVTATPTVTTTYTLTGTSGFCVQTRTVTVSVNASPTPIAGTLQWCKNTTTTLTSTPSGGTWSSSNSSIGSVNSTTGAVYGAGGGTALISYTKSGCSVSQVVTVLVTPAIEGVSSICPGLTTTLTNAISGGTWASVADTIATIDASTGLVTAIEEGVTTINYTAGTGCVATMQFTVGLPPAFTSGPWVCLGQTSQVAHPIAGGTWSSSNPARATIDAVSGVVYGVSLGNFYITYTLASGCARSMEMAVQTFPMNISGSLGVCAGSSTNLANETASGTWSSSDESVATITLSSGTAYGLSPGTTNITYKFQACYRSEMLTVNALPAAISGPDELCSGSTSAYTCTPVGGTWSSSNTASATIGLSSGIATGGTTSGVVTLTYTSPAGCRATKNITVNPQPGMLSGTTSLCAGAVATISCASNAGTWASSNGAVATVGSTLSLSTTLTAIAAGTTTVTTTTDEGCSRSIVITVGVAVTTIDGDAVLCPGNTLALTNSTPGGTWSSSNISVATIGTGGIVAGVGAGTATITYRTSASCYAIKQITVNPIPGAITGGSAVCVGNLVTLSHADAGGTWSSSNPSRASIDAVSGQVTGLTVGAVAITYQINSGCYKTLSMMVNAVPAAISGSSSICQGSATTFSNATTGGVWSSSNGSIASVPSSPGNVTGVSVGMATITYLVTATGCYATKSINVNAQPSAIGGGSGQLCVGAAATYNCTPTGGTWTSSQPSFASVDPTTGQMSGIATGTTTLSYTLGSGCYRTLAVAVNPLPLAIGGTAAVCRNATTTLNCATAGGTWSSAAIGTASVTPSGVVAGVAAGMTTITYKLTATGCQSTRQVTVNELPTAIDGASQICVGNTEMYSSTPTGGTWLSSAAAASIGSSSGIATGAAQGVTVLTYTAPITACRITKQVSVNPLPGVITGTVTTICVGNTASLTAGTASQTWSATTSAVSVTPTSTTTASVLGLSVGSSVISYTNAFGCARTITINVSPAVAPIVGDMIVCPTRTVNLSNTTPGGTWSSALTTRATVSATGVVTGVNPGNVNITYRVSTGCSAVANVTVNAIPAAITGPTSVCVGSEIDLNHATAGGTWNTASALVSLDAASGIVGGLSAGISYITYSINSGCWVTTTVNVKNAPAAITGTLAITVGSTSALANSVPGGTWSSSATGVASIGTSGIMTGVGAGTAVITYKLTSTLCYVTATATITTSAGRGVLSSIGEDVSNDVRMYPNPTTGILTIEAEKNGTFALYTLDGREVQQYVIEAPNTQIALPIDLIPGAYMCVYKGVDGSSKKVRIVYMR